MDHTSALYLVAQHPSIWRYMPTDPSVSLEAMQAWISAALKEQEIGYSLPFAIIEKRSGQVVGATRYLDIRPKDRNLEIGWTWLTPTVQQTGVNAACKYLLLQHTFETLQCIRVQFKTDNRNEKSKRALERLGAAAEGILRHHMIMPDGYYRDSAYYSILDNEWPTVKTRLQERMERKAIPSAE